MKRVILLMVSFLAFNLTSCNNSELKENILNESKPEEICVKSEELRGMWLSFYEISEITKGKTEAEYRESVNAILKNLSEDKLNTVYYQARAFSDAFYFSEIFPASEYLTTEKTDGLEYDPLEIFVETSKEYGVSVHAWVNPLRVSYSEDVTLLKDGNPAKKLYDEYEGEGLIICEKGIYYNPSDEEARKIILSGVREIIENYDVAGIQFDDYFYPESENIGDEVLFNEYRLAGGELSLGEWRSANVTNLISSVYELVKSYDEKLVFGVSPSADFLNNEKVYADIAYWCKESGYIDYIMPQVYYGFENEKMPFEETVDKWNSLERCDGVSLCFGLAPYKTGVEDKYAGTGINEWVENDDVLSRQYDYLRNNTSFSGFSMFSYSYCYGTNKSKNIEKELEVLTSMLQ